MRILSNFLSELSRTQASPITPEEGDTTLIVPPLWMPGGPLPTVCDRLGTNTSDLDPARSSIGSTIGVAFSPGGATTDVLYLDEGVWDISWTYYMVCTVVGTLNSPHGVIMQLRDAAGGGYLSQTSIAFSIAAVGTIAMSNQFRVSLPARARFQLITQPHATSVGFHQVGFWASKVL